MICTAWLDTDISTMPGEGNMVRERNGWEEQHQCKLCLGSDWGHVLSTGTLKSEKGAARVKTQISGVLSNRNGKIK